VVFGTSTLCISHRGDLTDLHSTSQWHSDSRAGRGDQTIYGFAFLDGKAAAIFEGGFQYEHSEPSTSRTSDQYRLAVSLVRPPLSWEMAFEMSTLSLARCRRELLRKSSVSRWRDHRHFRRQYSVIWHFTEKIPWIDSSSQWQNPWMRRIQLNV
jgi:hypothetical protein